MILRTSAVVLLVTLLLSGCMSDKPATPDPAENEANVDATVVEIIPGLTMKKLRNGYGRAAVAGDYATVHYTGWLYDESAPNNRGEKFDSSVDRGDPFEFPLGAGRVIVGWDNGVEGMLIGETRELTIAAEHAYGDRGAGDVIPPGATLVFEIDLKGLRAPNEE